jgi:hypothetical protein
MTVTRDNFINNRISAVCVATFPGDRSSQIVDNDPCTPFSKLMGIGSTDAVTCAGDNNNAIFECQRIRHWNHPF